MPRKPRIQSKSNIYHIMVRGNERKCLFFDDEDRQRFVDTMKRLIELIHEGKKEKKFFIYAYCLMDNHVHLLINQGEDSISRIMKSIGTSYAYYFNKKYYRIGHLFQDRFKSETVENDRYLLAVTRYIHNNPVKAGIVDCAFQFQWSSYLDYVENRQTDRFIDIDTILDIFSVNRKSAIDLFKEYSRIENEDTFIEYSETLKEMVFVHKHEIESLIENLLLDKGVSKDQLKEKKNFSVIKDLVCELRKKSNLSIRQMADILSVDRGVIQRIIYKPCKPRQRTVP
jgi:putative transposase